MNLRVQWVTITISSVLLLLFFQNCGQGFRSDNSADLSSQGFDNEGNPLIPPVEATPTPNPPPIEAPPVQIPQGVASFSSKAYTRCAIDSQSRLICWGSNGFGQFGGATPTFSVSPLVVPGPQNIKQVSTGSGHICAITAQDTVVCWGRNDRGQLGNGSTISSIAPVAVSGLQNVRALASSYYQTCALTNAGAVYCWGGNLLAGSNESIIGVWSTSPVLMSDLQGAKFIEGGYQHFCAITAQDRVACWGWGINGLLGDGTDNSSTTPVVVVGIEGVRQLSVGSVGACTLNAQGVANCWGGLLASLGVQLAVDNKLPRSIPNLAGLKQVEVGEQHLCMISSMDTVLCAGRNVQGQLGDNSTISSTTPVSVVGLTGIKRLESGAFQTCAVNATNAVSCWGQAATIQNQTPVLSTIPVPVMGLVLN